MKKVFSTKLLSVLCVIAILLTALPLGAVIGTIANEPKPAKVLAHIDFQSDETSMKIYNTFGADPKVYASWPKNDGDTTKTLEIKTEGTNKFLSLSNDFTNYIGTSFIINKNGELMNLTQGKFYTLVMRYRFAKASDVTGTSWFVLSDDYDANANNNDWGFIKPTHIVNDSTATYTSYEFRSHFIPHCDKQGQFTTTNHTDACGNIWSNDWQTISYTFAANTDSAPVIAGVAMENLEIQFDDIMLIENNDQSVIAYDTDDTWTLPSFGTPDTAVTKPNITDFYCWNSVTASGTDITDLKYPAIAKGAGKVYTVGLKEAAEEIAYIDFETTTSSMTTTNDVENNKIYTSHPRSESEALSKPGLNPWLVITDQGNKVLSFTWSNDMKVFNGDQQWGVSLLQLNKAGERLALEVGETYTLTFRYKRVGNITASNTEWLVLTNDYDARATGTGDSWGWFKPNKNVSGQNHGDAAYKNSLIPECSNTVNYTKNNMGGKDINGNPWEKDSWNTISYTFTATTTQALALAGSLTTGTEIYFDDFTLIKNNSDTVVAFDNGSGAWIKPTTGFAGEAVTYPTGPVNHATTIQAVTAPSTDVKDLKFPAKAVGANSVYNVKFTRTSWGDVDVNDYITHIDFENNSTVADGSITNAATVSSYQGTDNQIYSIVDEDEITPNKVLKIQFPSAYKNATWLNGVWVFNKDGKPVVLDAGQKYTISMRYKINTVGHNSGNNQWIMLADKVKQENTTYYGALNPQVNYTGGSIGGAHQNKLLNSYNISNYTTIKDANDNNLSVGNWQTISISFTACGNGTLPLGFASSTSSGSTVLVDDIRIFKDPAVAVVYNSNGGSEVGTAYGFPNEPLTAPSDPTRRGYKFNGWYTNDKLETKFEADNFPSQSTIVYAGWTDTSIDGAWSMDFTDTLDYDLTKYGYSTMYKSTGKDMFEISDGVLKAKQVGTGTFSTGVWLINKYGKPITLTPGQKYTFTFKYKYDKAPTASEPWIAITQGANSGSVSEWVGISADSSVMTDGKSYAYATKSGDANHRSKHKLTPSSDWQTKTIEFTAYDVASTNIANNLCLTVCAAGGQTLMFDDIAVIDNSKAGMVVINSDGGTEYSPIVGLEGADVLLPNDIKKGGNATFIGWYYDPEFKNAVPAVTGGYGFKMKKGSTSVYARFSDSATPDMFNFEQGYSKAVTDTTSKSHFGSVWYLHKAGQLSHGKAVAFDPQYCYSGNSSLLIDGTGFNSYYTVLLRNSFYQNGFAVKSGENYVVSFKYRVENGKTASGVSLSVAGVDKVQNGWYKLEDYADGVFAFPNVDYADGWLNGTMIYNNTTNKDQFIHLRVDISANPNAKIYIDDVVLRKVESDERVITIAANNGDANIYFVGKVGESFKDYLPTLSDSEYSTFKGWYTDKKCTKPYKGNFTVTNEALALYAKWDFKTGVTIIESFEDYKGALTKDYSITEADKASGKKSLRFEFDENHSSEDFIPLFLGDDLLNVSNGQRFAVSFKYKLDNPPVDPAQQLCLSFYSHDEVQQPFKYNYTKASQRGMRWWIRTTTITEEWLIFSDVIEIADLKGSSLYFSLGQGNSVKGYIDDITLTPLADTDIAICTHPNYAVDEIKPYYIGKKGATVTLPVNKKISIGNISNYVIRSWNSDESLTQEISNKLTFTEDTKIFPSIILQTRTQTFENFPGIAPFYMLSDDYEIYGPKAEGYSADNVKNGKMSLHRKGETHLWANTQVIEKKQEIGIGTFTATFWVKMTDSLHTDGAIRIISGNDLGYAYDTSGDYLNVIAIKDLADKQWHEVKYTFKSASQYFIISTPGYCNIYMDDVKIDYTPDSEVSEPVKVENEYDPLIRLKDGTIVGEEEKIVDPQLLAMLDPDKQTQIKTEIDHGVTIVGIDVPWVVVITVPAVLVAALAVLAVIIIKKRKNKSV